MRILLDTNIWVSAFLSPNGHCGRLVRQLLADGDVEIFTSLPLIEEIVDVLGRPRLTRRYGFAPEEVKGNRSAGIAYPLFGILLSPMFASAAMAFSSVSVIGNALRLRSTRL